MSASPRSPPRKPGTRPFSTSFAIWTVICAAILSSVFGQLVVDFVPHCSGRTKLRAVSQVLGATLGIEMFSLLQYHDLPPIASTFLGISFCTLLFLVVAPLVPTNADVMLSSTFGTSAGMCVAEAQQFACKLCGISWNKELCTTQRPRSPQVFRFVAQGTSVQEDYKKKEEEEETSCL